jgi:hypothetical protein
MRARHRHFNPKAAGAATALDARYLTFSDDAAVDTWTSRTGSNDATQATAARQPTFKTNVRGGQPVVRFSGSHTDSTQDFLQNTSFTLSQPFIAIAATIINTKDSYVFDATSGNRVAMGYNDTGQIADRGKPWVWAGGAGYPRENVDARGSWQILAGIYNGSSSSLRRNGTQTATGNVGNNNFSTLKIGETQAPGFDNTGHDGDIAALIIYAGSALPLLKRLTHHVAYSFKLSCN